jgi:hypothetical protein
MHRACDEGNGAWGCAALFNQVFHDLRIGPGLVVRLLFLRTGTELDHAGSSISKGEQDLFSVNPRSRHFGLRCENQVVLTRRTGHRPRRTVKQERQRGQPTCESGRLRCCKGSEFCNLAFTVHHEQITCGSRCDSPLRCWQANSRQAGNEHCSVTAPKDAMSCQGGDDRPGTSKQYNVWALAAYPPYERTERHNFHRPAA